MNAPIVHLSAAGLASLADAIENFKRAQAARLMADERLKAAFGEAVKVEDFPVSEFTAFGEAATL